MQWSVVRFKKRSYLPASSLGGISSRSGGSFLFALRQAGLGHLVLVFLGHGGALGLVELAILVGVVFRQHFGLDRLLFRSQCFLGFLGGGVLSLNHDGGGAEEREGGD